MIPPEKNPLTPRETAQRMLEHMPDDVSYGDIIRQLRILEDIEHTLNDVDLAGFPADEAVEEARSELETPRGDREPVMPSADLVLRSQPEGEGRPASGRRKPDDDLLRNARWNH